MKLALVVALLPLAACGRTGFDDVPDALPPAVLACGTAPQFELAQDITHMAATATTDGYVIFTVGADHNVNGYPLTLSSTDPTHTPVAGQPMMAITDQALGDLGAFASGSDLEIAVPYAEGDLSKSPPAQGTKLVPLSAQLAPRGAASILPGWIGQAGSIAYNTKGVAINVFESADHTIAASTAANASAAWSAQVTLAAASDNADMPVVTAADDKFLMAALNTSRRGVAQMFATSPTTTLAPTTPAPIAVTELTDHDINYVHVAYATGHGLALFVWFFKDEKNNDIDESWFSLRNAELGIVAEGKLADNAARPVVAAGDQDFLVAWEGSPIGGARVAFDGTVTPVTITNTGNPAIQCSLKVVNHNGQPTLIWAEQTPATTVAWINPACAPGAAATP